MRRHSFLFLAGVLCVQPALAQRPADTIFSSDVKPGATPWTDTSFYNDPANFQFAIVADRTNGHRPGVFKGAMEKLNAMHPEFVLSIGDFIEGYTRDTALLTRQWKEFNDLLRPLKMPFFRVPGNHDVSNQVQQELWLKQFGRDYYHFIYKEVLFIIMNSNDGDGVPFSEEQLAYVEQTVRQHQQVRWTFVLMHHPVWVNRDQNGFNRVEEALKNRPYTIIAGHTHKYLYATHHQRDYFVLGTTGGSSGLRGPGFGETDHISWVTMTDKGPSLMNIQLDGMLKPDFATDSTHALGRMITNVAARKPLVMLPKEGTGEGRLYLDINNTAGLPLQYTVRTYQHPDVIFSKPDWSLTVPAGEYRQMVIGFNRHSITPANTKDTVWWQSHIHYVTTDEGLPAVDKDIAIPLQPSVPAIIHSELPVFTFSHKVVMDQLYPQTVLRYTTNGEEPVATSAIYSAPFEISNTTTVKVKIFTPDGKAESASQSVLFSKLPFIPGAAIKKSTLSKGLKYDYYEGAFKRVPDFSQLQSLRNGIMTSFDLNPVKLDRMNQFGLRISGFMEVPQDGLYKFYLSSDDGCRFFIGDSLVVDNDGSHSARTRTGYMALKKGIHPIRLNYFEDFDGELIRLEYEIPGEQPRQLLPFDWFWHSFRVGRSAKN